MAQDSFAATFVTTHLQSLQLDTQLCAKIRESKLSCCLHLSLIQHILVRYMVRVYIKDARALTKETEEVPEEWEDDGYQCRNCAHMLVPFVTILPRRLTSHQ